MLNIFLDCEEWERKVALQEQDMEDERKKQDRLANGIAEPQLPPPVDQTLRA